MMLKKTLVRLTNMHLICARFSIEKRNRLPDRLKAGQLILVQFVLVRIQLGQLRELRIASAFAEFLF
jgi:hypothetical protein